MKRVIIADDSQTARMFIRRCLEIAGLRDAQFVEVDGGESALKALEEGPADLLFTDLTMPGIDGTELVKRVRAEPRWSEMPIVVITSAKNPAKEEELLGFGATAVLGKPVSPATVSQILKKLASKENNS